MDLFRKVSRAALTPTMAVGLTTAIGLGGCLHVRTDADGKLAAIEFKLPSATAADGMRTASATDPADPVASRPPLAKRVAKGPPPKGTPSQMALGWHNRISYLPNPARNGEMGAGIVGQMFLFDTSLQCALANGRLTVELFDDSNPTQGGMAQTKPGPRLGTWKLEKDVLHNLVTADERFGKSYALFLPWPDYTPTITRVRLTARFDPEDGYPIFAIPTTVTFDTTPAGAAPTPVDEPGRLPLTGLGSVAPAVTPVGYTPPPPGTGANAGPIPIGNGVGGHGPAALPPGLPPIVLTLPASR